MPVVGEDGRFEHRFRQSWLRTLLKCPELARADLADEFVDQDMDSGVVGTGMHAGIENVLNADIEGRTFDEIEAHDTIENTIDKLRPWRKVKYSEAQVYDLSHASFDVWLDQVYGDVQPLRVEHKYKHVLYEDDERVIYLGGMRDCDDAEGFVWDWKQGEREYERWEYQRWAVQPTAYTWARAQEDPGEEPWWFRYAVILHQPRRGGVQYSVQYLDVWRDSGYVTFLQQQAYNAALLIEAELPHWPMTDDGWWCSEKWCPMWSQCKGKHMHDDWQKSERSVVTPTSAEEDDPTVLRGEGD